MKWVKLNLLMTVGLVLLLGTAGHSQLVQDEFIRAFGGAEDDEAYSIALTADGGFIVAGRTYSFGEGVGTSEPNLLIVRYDSTGNVLWARTLGSTGGEEGVSVTEASDGGFIVTGETRSYGAGARDLLLAKFDAAGSHLWTIVLGGSNDEKGLSVIEASDGELVVVGVTHSYGVGGGDLLIWKVGSWVRTLGDTGFDEGRCVVETSDGGFVVTGVAGGHELLLAKFDASGNHLWTRRLQVEAPGFDADEGSSLIETSGGRLVVVGRSEGYAGPDSTNTLIAEFDTSGNHLSTRTLRSFDCTDKAADWGHSLTETPDGCFLITGVVDCSYSESSDLYLAKFDSLWDHIFTWTLGGGQSEEGWAVVPTSDGYVAMGWSESYGAGANDILLAKFSLAGRNCLGESVDPAIVVENPTIDSTSLIVTYPAPTTSGWDPVVTEPTLVETPVCSFTPNPQIISITDVGNDQGKQVRIKWHRCYYDSVDSPVTITEYSLWRRIDEDKFNNQGDEMRLTGAGMFGRERLYPPGDWDFIKTVPAIGEVEYNTVCPTLGDSTLTEGMYWSVFFVIAHTEEPLIHYDSDPDSGYSLDNIPPLPILDLEIDPNSWFTLEWTVPGEYVGEEPISSYDIRYSPVPIGPDTQAWWDSAEVCAGDGFFNFTVGEEDSYQVAKETWCHPESYFAIKGLDSRPNASGISNIVHFLCGDATNDGVIDIGDVVKLINYLYKGGDAPEPMAAGDCTCDGVVELGDVVHLINYLFKNGDPPCSSQ